MTEPPAPSGYEQTKAELENLERRLAEIQADEDLPYAQREQMIRSCREMIQKYRPKIKLYEFLREQGIPGH
jgi:hypothetical protein